MRPIKSIQVFFDAMLYPHGSWWCRMTITKTAQSTSYLSVTSCLLLLLHLLKVSVNRTPELKCKKQLCIFFLFGTERMNQTTDVKAPEPKSRKQTNPAVDMRLQCSARLNCCFLFSIESGGFERKRSVSAGIAPITLSNTYNNNLTIYFANSKKKKKKLLYVVVIQTPRFV